MSKLMMIIASVLVAFIFSCSNSTDCPVSESNPFVDYESEVNVSRVIDGDTFIFMINDEEFSVRILDMDCFETKHNARLQEQAIKAGISEDSAYILGHLAKNMADSVMTNKVIRITRDSIEENFDTYARLLRHAWVNGRKWSDILKEKHLVVWGD